ncbi:hypothetical protein G4Y73_13495 [Wenzhouxiangella sp. XN201]|uniref:hypothetical protein n=1 Tax=Wenzhouxiangella sp. XN201 TaxID=2710755 RepID=UPI0013C61801|nr:hypothetical protein [Wenzhouxiangella sp. XN201]NEZ05165.1 hypothetical protein [Wenzhouxiangella sp. XN201]
MAIASKPSKETEMQRTITLIILAAVVVMYTGTAMANTTISYQGRLDAGGQAFDGSVDMVFELFDAESNGNPVGSPVATNGVPVLQGLFQVELDFGAQAWDLGRWLQITVDGQLLSPRQKVTAAPLASRAETVIEEAVGSQELEDGGVQAVDIADNSIYTNHIVDGTITGADTDKSFWNATTRGSLYVKVDQRTINFLGSRANATAACEEVEDIPVSGACVFSPEAGSSLGLESFEPTNWGDPMGLAAYSCVYSNNANVAGTFEARIHCLDTTP